jgi:hypothetical protein
VSSGFPIINFCNPRVHYETPCIVTQAYYNLDSKCVITCAGKLDNVSSYVWYKCCYVKVVDGQNEQHRYCSHQTSWSVIQGVPRRGMGVILIFAHASFCSTLQKKYLQYLQQFICYCVGSSQSMLAVMWILAIPHEDAFQTRRKNWSAQKIWLDCIFGANDTMWYHTALLFYTSLLIKYSYFIHNLPCLLSSY